MRALLFKGIYGQLGLQLTGFVFVNSIDYRLKTEEKKVSVSSAPLIPYIAFVQHCTVQGVMGT